MQEARLARSVLCVGCDASTQAVLGTAMSEWNLAFAPNAAAALSLMSARHFHAYVLDYWLPDWAGPAFCRDIRKYDPHVPIVFYTAAARDEERARALRAGANAYMIKPVEPALLRAKLSALVAAAEVASLAAKAEEERAIQDELARRYSETQERVERAAQLRATSIERTARAKAYKAFMEARGTRAHFENWWPQVFASAKANRET